MNAPGQPGTTKVVFDTYRLSNGEFLTSALSDWGQDCLADIEARLGPRDHSFGIFKTEFDETPQATPRIWFPTSGVPYGNDPTQSKPITIRLTANPMTSLARAKWQLAHECVHLLDPWMYKAEGENTNYLEEGLATWYQFERVSTITSSDSDYDKARGLVSKYQSVLPDCVREIRAHEHNVSGKPLRIGEINPGLLMSYCREIVEVDAVQLCERFPLKGALN